MNARFITGRRAQDAHEQHDHENKGLEMLGSMHYASPQRGPCLARSGTSPWTRDVASGGIFRAYGQSSKLAGGNTSDERVDSRTYS